MSQRETEREETVTGPSNSAFPPHTCECESHTKLAASSWPCITELSLGQGSSQMAPTASFAQLRDRAGVELYRYPRPHTALEFCCTVPVSARRCCCVLFSSARHQLLLLLNETKLVTERPLCGPAVQPVH